jgi:hypothetical protein
LPIVKKSLAPQYTFCFVLLLLVCLMSIPFLKFTKLLLMVQSLVPQYTFCFVASCLMSIHFLSSQKKKLFAYYGLTPLFHNTHSFCCFLFDVHSYMSSSQSFCGTKLLQKLWLNPFTLYNTHPFFFCFSFCSCSWWPTSWLNVVVPSKIWHSNVE